jgi:hypothetical protein
MEGGMGKQKRPLSSWEKKMTPKDRALERQSDELLKPWVGNGRANGIYRDIDLDRMKQREILPLEESPEMIAFVDCSTIGDDDVTISELVDEANLTTEQKRAVRLLMGIGWKQRPVDQFGRPVQITQRMVALEMGVTQQEVSHLLKRAKQRVAVIRPMLSERMPNWSVQRLWWEELQTKKRQVYIKRITRFKVGERDWN